MSTGGTLTVPMSDARRSGGVTPLVIVLSGLLVVVGTLTAQEPATQSFADFLAGVRSEAISKGIKASTLDAAFAGIDPVTRVVARDRAQPEQVQSLEDYVRRRVTAAMIRTGRAMRERHRATLTTVEAEYGVPPHVMLAIWGIESNFGRFTGTYPVIPALATLAYDGRRPLFRSELLSALTIVDRGIAPLSMLMGSWAGAMGQPQFMPSSFLEKAVDFDRDGKTDIWRSHADVFGSMANYLEMAGWAVGERWGREVAVSPRVLARIEQQVPMRTDGCRAIREMSSEQPLAAWRELGVTLRGGAALPAGDLTASLVRGSSRFFLVYRNFHALLDYNCSNAYAVTIGLLADALGR
jgi:membrane-bound lytic murein transglycosylase B